MFTISFVYPFCKDIVRIQLDPGPKFNANFLNSQKFLVKHM